jgi:hypothetical protein
MFKQSSFLTVNTVRTSDCLAVCWNNTCLFWYNREEHRTTLFGQNVRSFYVEAHGAHTLKMLTLVYSAFNARCRTAVALHINLRLYLELVIFWPFVCEILTPWSTVFVLFLLLVLLWRLGSFSCHGLPDLLPPAFLLPFCLSLCSEGNNPLRS